MKKYLLLMPAVWAGMALMAQQPMTLSNPDIVPVKLERISKPVREAPEVKVNLKGLLYEHENEALEKHNPIVNPNAQPKGEDGARQQVYNHGGRSTEAVSVNVLATLQGLSASVNPSDNTVAVGKNHVVQLTNNNTSTLMRIWDKAGNVLVNSKTIQSFSGIADYGDPNILYDQLANRYVFVLLYSRNRKMLEVCVSKDSVPTGDWYVYSFSTPNGFPDYPKIGVWGNSYFITTNSNSPTIYALNRTAMLNGSGTGTAQVFSLSKFPNIGFQAASPVSQTGALAPPAGVPASVIRVADDAWSSTLGPDHLQMFNLNINWTTPSSSTITGPVKLNTIAYNSSLCGFGSSSCIPQPGTTTKLDPLSDIIMDKVQYRNYGTYEALVCSHICNADGNGTAGIRWYELRRNAATGSWYIYQQSTYAPNNSHRFMSSISLNNEGTIALGYNLSSSTVYPGIRITGRDSCDALNSMTVAETVTTAGTAASGSSRYGDYNAMVADPVDGSFWFTAQYNSASLWSTKLVHFNFSNCPAPAFKMEDATPVVETTEDAVKELTLVPNPAGDAVRVSFISSGESSKVEVFNLTGQVVMEQTQTTGGSMNQADLYLGSLANGAYLVKVSNRKGPATKRLIVQR